MRQDGRSANQLRPVHIETDFLETATGSVLISMGKTKVLCSAQVINGVPDFLKGTGRGWLTAEYAMLPGSTARRVPRSVVRKDGRSTEIQRLIGRSLRAVTDLYALPELTIYIDCDVLQADGGTRSASVTGGFVALCLAIDKLLAEGRIARSPITQSMAAVSAGVVQDRALLDLDYSEDSQADIDINIVMTQAGEFIEIQGTGEGRPFSRKEMIDLLDISHMGNADLMRYQAGAMGKRSHLIGKDFHPNQLLIASNNVNKVKEIKALLGDYFTDIKSIGEAGWTIDVVEDGSTFEQNARKKALEVMRITGCSAIADDSGLCVDALDGQPGIYSARYTQGTDADRNEHLLANLEGMKNRTAHFQSVAALAIPMRGVITAEGMVEGEILTEGRGKGGFGYDPLFYYPEFKRSFAEMSPDQKNSVSHRARALAALKEKL